MKEYDVIVIGSGAGAIIADKAVANKLKVAMVDKGPLGGTCLNVGCIPSKILIVPADRVVEIQDSGKLGVHAEIKSIDFPSIMKRMNEIVQTNQEHIRKGIEHTKKLDFYADTAAFVDSHVLEVGGVRIKGKRVYIVSGARPSIPPIKGIEEIDYLTNENVLSLTDKPESLIIVGGGYIAVEYAHFFSAMGSRVTVLQRGQRLVKEEEPEISSLLEKEMGRRMSIFTHTEVLEAHSKNGRITVLSKNIATNKTKKFSASNIMIATGRISNADLLQVKKAGIKTDRKKFIQVNDFFETNVENIWAVGDAIGKKMFRHSANREAEIVWHNSMFGKKGKLDFNTIPHAVFSYPPIASVGIGEAQAKKSHRILVGKATYDQVAKGEAMQAEESLAKIILKNDSGEILGFHIIGPYAPILIQEVVNAMASEKTVMPLVRGIHIHPALPEIIHSTLGNLREPQSD